MNPLHIDKSSKRRWLKHADCQHCRLFGEPMVFGNGLKDCEVGFIGEAPGEVEAELGKPFQGKAGRFLKMVTGDLGFVEKRSYFTNMLLCRPPKNRKPKADELACCFPRLLAELREARPKFLVVMGGTAVTKFMGLKGGITRVHGVYRDLKLADDYSVGAISMYHPSGVLRGPEFFLDFAYEMEKVRDIIDGVIPPVIPPPYENYHVIDTQQTFLKFLKRLEGRELVSIDIETNRFSQFDGEIMCVGFSWKRKEAWVVDWTTLLLNNFKNVQRLDKALKGVKLSLQNGMYDIPFLQLAGMKNLWYYFDTMMAHYLIDERQGTHGLERLAIKYCNAPDYKTRFRKTLKISGFVDDEKFAQAIAKVNRHRLFMYNGADTDYTYRLTKILLKRMKEEDQTHILFDIEMPSAKMFMEFTQYGMLIDRDYLNQMAKGWRNEIKDLDQQMASFPGAEGINVGSPKQLAGLFYDTFGLLPFGGKDSITKQKIDENVISEAIRTTTDPEAREYWTRKRSAMSEGMKGLGGTFRGMPPRSTTTYMLYYLKQQHPFPGLLIRRRTLAKRYSNYYNGIKRWIYKDGRVRPLYNMTATRTGRKASEHPAIHNLPRGDEIYNIFIADPGFIIIHADYSQAEMRMMAHYSGDKALVHLLNTTDIHTVIAARMFGFSVKDAETMDKDRLKEFRIASKMVSFGIPYGRCVHVQEKVLTSKLIWKRAGDLAVGEKLIAFDEFTGGYGNSKTRRKWQIAEVTSAEHDTDTVYAVFLSDGSVIKTTAEHLWLTGNSAITKWIRTDALYKGIKLPKVLREWQRAIDYNSGYVSGILDAEGSFSSSRRDLGYTQRLNSVYRKTNAVLRAGGFVLGIYDHHKGIDDVKSIRIRGGFPEILRCLGQFGPKRLINQLENGEDLPSFTLPDRDRLEWCQVSRVVKLGKEPIVRLATTTKTFFVGGFPVHNSAAGLAPQLGINKDEAQIYLDKFFEPIPDLKIWLDEHRRNIMETQVATSLFGRRRRFPFIRDVHHRWEVEKQGGNMPIQCLGIGTKVLNSKLEWVPVETLKIGSELLAFDEESHCLTLGWQKGRVNGPANGRKWLFTKVTDTQPDKADILKLTFDDGTIIEATPEHKWLVYNGTSLFWRRTDKLKVGISRVAKTFENTWISSKGYKSGYIAGVFDSEGTLYRNPENGAFGLKFTQVPNELYERMLRYLTHYGYDFWPHKNNTVKYEWMDCTIKGGKPELIRFLGQFQPPRLLSKLRYVLTGATFKNRSKWAKLVSIVPILNRPIVRIATESKTFFAEGFPTHNSAINDLTLIAHFRSLEKLRAAGIECHPWPHIHDSINILVPKPLWKPAVKIIADTMSEIPFESEVGFPVEVEIGERWGDMTTVYKDGQWIKGAVV